MQTDAAILDIEFDCQPKQSEFLSAIQNSDFTELWKGGARGGGKSEICRNAMLTRRLQIPGTSGLIFRRTYDDLWDGHINPILTQWPWMREFYIDRHKQLTFPNSSVVQFGHGQYFSDVENFKKQFYDVFVDEATELSEDEHHLLRTSRRWPGASERACKKWNAANPGGPGHAYVKRVMFDREFLPKENPRDFYFLPSWGWDNVFWATDALEKDGLTISDYYSWTDEERREYFVTRTQYGADLNALPSHLRSANLDGNWDQFEGQLFSDLNERTHNLDNWAGIFNPHGCKLISGLDHARSGTVAFVETAWDSRPDPNCFAVEEYYQPDRKISEHCEEIVSIMNRWQDRPVNLGSAREPLKQEYTLLDCSEGPIKASQGKPQLWSVQREYTLNHVPTHVVNKGAIEIGLNLIAEYLAVDETRLHPFTGQPGSPRLFISKSRCKNLWAELRGLQRKIRDNKVEFLGDDHALDCLRYVVMSRPAPAKPLPIVDQRTLQERSIQRVHSRWAQTFDKQTKGNGNQWGLR